jgi:tight adherence protein B
MIYFILSLIIGLSSAIFVWAIFVIEKDLSPNTLKRLDRIKHKTNITKESNAADNLEMEMKDTEYKVQVLGDILKKYKITDSIKNLILLSDSKMQIDTFIFLSLMSVLPFVIFLLTPFKLMALFGLVALFAPTFYLKNIINKRFLDFSKQFPDALNLMASSLRAGHPLFAAINIVTDEMPKPICTVFETAQRDISLGIDTKVAFLNMTKTMPLSIDLRFFITAVLIQKEIGGNLAELLDSLSGTIRERFKLIGQLRVSTAQTKISGIVLGVVPIGVLLIIFFMNPEYIKPLFETQDGQIAFVIAIGLIIAGFVSIKKISTIEI